MTSCDKKYHPVLYNFESCSFILLSSKNNNCLVLRSLAKTVETSATLKSRAWSLINLPTECSDNFDNALQVLIPPFALVVCPNSNSHVTVWVHNPLQNRTSAKAADTTITGIINNENFLTYSFLLDSIEFPFVSSSTTQNTLPSWRPSVDHSWGVQRCVEHQDSEPSTDFMWVAICTCTIPLIVSPGALLPWKQQYSCDLTWKTFSKMALLLLFFFFF